MSQVDQDQDQQDQQDSEISGLRLPQGFDVSSEVKKQLLSIPVRKPDRHWFVRVHPEESHRMVCGIIELREEREVYVVHQSMVDGLRLEMKVVQLYLAVSRTGTVFLWPIRLPAEDGRILEWHRSAAEAAAMAMDQWVRVVADMSAGAYQVYGARGELPEPTWPDHSFEGIVTIAFKGKIIDSPDHPIVRRLQGEI